MIGRSLVSLLALATAQAALAQSTNIVPDVAPGLSLGTTVGNSGNTYTIDGGTTSGANLFHSFSDFDLGAGDIAQWVYSSGDPAGIDNVVSRVTGGSPSSIMGILDSTAIPNADFYFINPAGIVFSGQDAQVNVPAAAHFSTASELRFANGQVFSVATPSGSTLSVAAPQSFGFLGNEGDILVTSIENIDDTPFIANAGPLSLSAANITFDNAFIGSNEQTVTAVGAVPLELGVDGSTNAPADGRIEMVGSWLQTWAADCYEACLGAEGFISLNAGELDIDSSGVVADFDSVSDEGGTSFVRLIGNNAIAITDSAILADGYETASAGDVTIVSQGEIAIIDSIVLAYTQGSGTGGLVEISGANVLVSGGVVGSESVGAGDGGSVVITAADTIQLENDAWILTTGYDSGAAGSIVLTASEISIADSLVASESYGSGNAGTVSVNAADGLTALNSLISSSTYAEGNGGSVAVAVGGFLLMDASTISSNSSTTGDAGDVSVAAGEAVLTNGSVISSDGFVDGDAGDISVVVTGQLLMEGASRISSGGGQNLEGEDPAELAPADISIESSPPPPPPPPPVDPPLEPIPTSGLGNAGAIKVTAGQLSMTEYSEISTRSYGEGAGGSIDITAGEIDLLLSKILSDSIAAGDAGDVQISASDVRLSWNSMISSDALGAGDAGNLNFDVDGLLLVSSSEISSDAGAGSGNGGNITINAEQLNVVFAIISATAGGGQGGEVNVTADSLIMNSARIWTQSGGEGDAGTVNIGVLGEVRLFDSDILSDAHGGGDAGNIYLEAGSAALNYGSTIASRTASSGAGGSISLDITGELHVHDDSTIAAGSLFDSTGAGGDVSIRAATVKVTGWSSISTTSEGAGNGGSVAISADEILVENSQIASDSFETGNAGDVELDAAAIMLTGVSAISSDSHSTDGGRGGNVSILADELQMADGSRVSTTSANANAAGRIDIAADALSMTGVGTAISSENVGNTAGAAGSVVIHSNAVSITDGARVSTNSLTGAAGDITFDMAPGSLLILSGETLPGVIETSSGPGTGGVITIASPLAIISNGGIISALGESGGAKVQIGANYFIASSDRPNLVQVDGNLTFSNAIYDVSSGTTKADLTMVDASGVLQGQCSTVRSTGQLSQLNIRPAGPYGDAALPSIRGIGSKVPATGGTTSGACQ